METFSFQKEQFNRLFPFYIQVDHQLNISSCGETVVKLFPNCLRKHFNDWFALERPKNIPSTFESFKQLHGQVVVFRSLQERDILLRGQIEYLEEHNQLLLLLTPWFDSVERLLENNLTLDDFSLHDSTVDLLHVLKSQEISANDMKELIAQIKVQKDELKKLSLLIEDSVNAVIITDVEGRVEWVNKGFYNITGYSLEEIKGKKPGKILQGENTSKATSDYLKTQIHKREPFSCEILNYHKKGHPYWIRISGQPLFDKKGNVTQFFAIEEDITKEKLANEKLKESESRMSALIVNLQTGILLEDENRQVLLTNERFCNMFGVEAPPEMLIGADCVLASEQSKVIFKEPEEFIHRIKSLIDKKEVVIGEELDLADGRIFERNYIPIEQNGIYKGHLWTYDDVTIKRNYQKSLHAQKEKYSNIITNMNLGLLEFDNDGIIQFANHSFCVNSGYTLEELQGKLAADMMMPDSRELFVQHNTSRADGVSDSYEIKVRTKSGKKRYWLVSGAPNYDVNGNIVGSIKIQLDITQQKKLVSQKEQLLKSLASQNEQLNEYAHIVSHDLKSPLRNISALLSWTKEDFSEKLGEESLMNLNLMQDKVEKMDYLIDNILKYSSIEKGKIANREIDLNELVHKIIDMIFVPEHITINVKQELPKIVADETRIQQLFQNLISNAVNYTQRADGKVEIDFTENDTHFVFSVKDNGIGIAPEHHEKIFKVFSSLGNHEKSTGIGLSIVKKVVDLYQGKVWLESEVGEGTTFFFSLIKDTQ